MFNIQLININQIHNSQVRYLTKRFLTGSTIKKEDDLVNVSTDWRLAVEIVSRPAAIDVSAKVAVVNAEITQELRGTESA
jgi:hypothetical protein